MDEPYVVVQFTNEKKKGKNVVDLVPMSWVTLDDSDETGTENKCRYPPLNEVDLTTLVKEKQDASPSWKEYAVRILKRAKDYEQGMRRMERAYCETNIDSTPDEEKNDNGRVVKRNVEQFVSSDDDDVSSSTGSPIKKTKTTAPVSCAKEMTPPNRSHSDSEECEIQGVVHVEKKRLKGKRAADIGTLELLRARLDRSDEQAEKNQKKLAKLIKGAKQSILYDLNTKIEALKNTIIANNGPAPGETIKRHRNTLGISFPIKNDDAFVAFNDELENDDEKMTALKSIMANSVGISSDVKEAVRKIISSIITKTVQELYSAAGKKGPNGVTKKSFKQTLVYSCMTDVLKEKLEKADDKSILSLTSRYLSGAGDREGGKAERDAKKAKK